MVANRRAQRWNEARSHQEPRRRRGRAGSRHSLFAARAAGEARRRGTMSKAAAGKAVAAAVAGAGGAASGIVRADNQAARADTPPVQKGIAKLVVAAGEAKPGPAIGQALGPLGLNMAECASPPQCRPTNAHARARSSLQAVQRGHGQDGPWHANARQAHRVQGPHV